MSWVSGLFTTTQAPKFAPESSHDSTAFSDLQDYAAGQEIGHQMPQSRQNTFSMEEAEKVRRPYWQCMIAGGIGGTSGDLLMHSIDTVKTRQQGDPHMPPKYGSLSSAYSQIFRQEGFRRGLYSGVTPAFLGSFPGTIIFFGTYEYSKRWMIETGVNHTLAYLAGGFLADFAASFVYVPSEVLKTRLQLQGRYNNPFFTSGYNYRSTLDAARTIVRQEGVSALFYGYKATIFRDLPFSALQFAFYEQERTWAKQWAGSKDIGIGLEIATAASAGGIAGMMTCPLDVVKTRIQTQINPPEAEAVGAMDARKGTPKPTNASPSHVSTARIAPQPMQASRPRRHIATSSPNTTLRKPGAVNLDTSSVMTGLRMICKTEGIIGLFRGVGPRFVWTSVQSGTMLVLYQMLLQQMQDHPWLNNEGASLA